MNIVLPPRRIRKSENGLLARLNYRVQSLSKKGMVAPGVGNLLSVVIGNQ